MQASSKNSYDLIDVFLFDLDGTLTETLSSLKRIYFSFMSDRNVAGSDAEFEQCNGLRIIEVVEKLKVTHSLPETVDELFSAYTAKLRTLEDEAKVISPGARELIEYLISIGVRCGVVTSASEVYARKILQDLRIEQFFTVVIGSESVVHGKPHPEPYLTAVRLLNSNPERVLAVEDSAQGIAAAARARIKCIGFSPNSFQSSNLYAAGAFEVVSSMGQIRAIVERFRHVRPSLYSASTLTIVEGSVKGQSSSESDKRVELYWGALAKAHDHLFDGSATFLRSTEKSQKHLTINVGSCPYRYIVAGCRGMITGIEGLAVTGIVVTDVADEKERHYLIGKRSEDVLQHPGCWEFIPSGAIDQDARTNGALDPEEQLIRELQEEVSLEREHIAKIEFLGLIRDINYKVADLCYMIKIKPNVIPSLRSESPEYTCIKTVNFEELQAMIQDISIERVPTIQTLVAWSQERISR